MRYLILILFVLFSAVACESKNEPAKDDKKTEAPPEVATVPVTIKDLDGLTINLVKADEPTKMGSEFMFLSMEESFMLSPSNDNSLKTLDEAKAKAAKEKGAKITEVAVDGGWALTFEAKSDDKTTYWLLSRREIDGKSYDCHTSVAFESLRDGATRACKSLRK